MWILIQFLTWIFWADFDVDFFLVRLFVWIRIQFMSNYFDADLVRFFSFPLTSMVRFRCGIHIKKWHVTFFFFFCRMWISNLCQKILSCALTCSFPIEINGMRIASRFQCGIGIGFRSGSTSNFTCEHTLRVGSHDCGFFWKFQTRLHVESVSIPCQKSAVWTLSCPAL